jgi:hypothetical protein
MGGGGARRRQGFCGRTSWPLLALFAAAPAAAAEPCPTLAVQADPVVQTRWPDLAARIRAAFGGREDIDACGQVRLGLRDASIEVTVALPDGRSASRLLERPADVEPTLAALLLLPERHTATAEPEPARRETMLPATTPVAAVESNAPPASVAPVPHARTSPAADRPTADTPQPDPSGVGVELSLITGARAGDGMLSVGLGALSLLDISSLVIALEGRVESYSGVDGAAELAPTLALAALGGYRLRFGSTALDLAAGPGLTMVTAQVTETIARMDSASLADPTARMETRTSSVPVVPRLVVAAHYRFAMHSLLRAFAGVDGQVGPALESDAPPQSGAPRLPVWAVGLVLGATVGTR